MERFIRFLASYKGSIILMLIYSFGLALATFVESEIGTEAAKMLIYYSPIFIFLQFLLVANFILILVNSNYIKKGKWALIVIHLALIVILGGALITFLFGKEGQVHIRDGDKTDQMVMHTSKGIKTETLPFKLELIDFRLNRYPGSQSPSSYESDLLIHLNDEIIEASVYMNNVLDLKGYRFFQASYDEDELGTVLSVNRDVAGRIITYMGYILLLVGFLLMFFMPNSRFRKLGKQLQELRNKAKGVGVILFLSLIPIISIGQNDQVEKVQQNIIQLNHADKFGAMPVQFRGRIMPMNTFSSEILRKLHSETTIYSLNSDQFLLSLLAMPQIWMQVPFISVNNDYVTYQQFFDENGNYLLLKRLQEIYHRPQNERSESDKDLIKLDEKINIFYLLLTHSLPGVFPNPDDPTNSWQTMSEDLTLQSSEKQTTISAMVKDYLKEVIIAIENDNWLSADNALSVITNYQLENDNASLINQSKLDNEIKYNRLSVFNYTKLGYFIFGVLLLILSFAQMLQKRVWIKYAIFITVLGIILTFLYHIFGMGLRWYISGYAPWSNSYETMVYVAWATVLAGLILSRKSSITLALATLFGGVILFISTLSWMDPQIGTLVPVLKSPWLMFHVAVIVAAYGFFGISFLLGLTNLIIMSFTKITQVVSYRISELSIINNMSLLIGLALMTIGTFLGAVWANESWGRYWGWDPKETWALITIVVYSIVTHLHLVRKWNNNWHFNLFSVFAFSSVLMTYLGVNFFFSGMHSYGQMDGSSSVFLYIAIAFLLIALLGILSYRRRGSINDFLIE